MIAKALATFVGALIIIFASVAAQADVFNMGGSRNPDGTWAGPASLQMFAVRDPGNSADTVVMSDGTMGYGSVPYVYQMARDDVTVGQYCQFLNAVAKTDPYGLYVSAMAPQYYPTIGITQSGSPGNYTYSVTGSYSQAANCPMPFVSWGDAARFCNWLQNGQPTSPEGDGTTETGAYTLTGAVTASDLMAITRNAGAEFFIPSENEWYKAAYYKGGGTNAGYWSYPTQSNTPPINILSSTGTNNANCYDSGGTGNRSYTDPTNKLTPVRSFAASPSPYGTFDQGGNIWQWTETAVSSSLRGLRGGFWGANYGTLVSSDRDCRYTPNSVFDFIGFRVARTAPLPPNYKQFAGNWGDDPLIGSTPDKDGNIATMRNAGCLVTSAAILLNTFGSNMDAGQFNTYLTNNFSNPDGIFPSADKPLKNVLGQATVWFKDANVVSGSRQNIIDQLCQKISEYGGVILRVPSYWTKYGGLAKYNDPKQPFVHYILAYQVIHQNDGSEQVLIRDPGDVYGTDTASLLSPLTLHDYVTNFNSIMSAHGMQTIDDNYSWLQNEPMKYATTGSNKPVGYVTGHSPIDFVLTDALGRRLGYDPVHGVSYNEIPDSFYGRDATIAVPDGFTQPASTGYNPIDAEIGELIPGQYSVQVFGLDSGSWSIDFAASDPNQMLSFDTSSLSGTVSAGSYSDLSVNVTPEPSVLALLGLGTISLLAYTWRRCRA